MPRAEAERKLMQNGGGLALARGAVGEQGRVAVKQRADERRVAHRLVGRRDERVAVLLEVGLLADGKGRHLRVGSGKMSAFGAASLQHPSL